MNATLNYQEPYRFSAGILALTVHLFFFTLLYFGVHWQSKPPEEFMVQIWDSLPNTEVASEQQSAPSKMELKQPAKVVAPVSPPVKGDIELRDKKNKKLSKKEKAKVVARQEAERKELEVYERNKKAQQERVQNTVRAEVSTATRVQVERYRDLIINKIRRKRKEVADVPESAEAIFKVTLLPDGTLVDDPVLVKSSGFPAYDDAAERAILAAEPLPVPTDPSLQIMFRELKLSIRP
jgi:colicin import membrane protein